MATFSARVELHGALSNSIVYKALHREMLRRGFKETVEGEDGHTYAKEAAGQTGRRYAVLVTESAGRFWSGLREEE